MSMGLNFRVKILQPRFDQLYEEYRNRFEKIDQSGSSERRMRFDAEHGILHRDGCDQVMPFRESSDLEYAIVRHAFTNCSPGEKIYSDQLGMKRDPFYQACLRINKKADALFRLGSIFDARKSEGYAIRLQ